MRDENIIVREATKDDVDAFHAMQEADPDHGHTHTLWHTIKAWVVEKDGKLACIAGISFADGYNEAFSDVMPNLVASKRTRYKYAKILADKMRELKLPIVVALGKENPDSSRFLMSMGFTFVTEKHNRKVFRL